MDNRKLRCIQVLVVIYQRMPNKTDDKASHRDNCIPAMISKRREKPNKKRYERRIEREKKIVRLLPSFTDMLRCVDEQFVLLQQVIVIFIAVLLRSLALQLT